MCLDAPKKESRSDGYADDIVVKSPALNGTWPPSSKLNSQTQIIWSNGLGLGDQF
jgi:hypothetical protein